jgi:hypothetical protein
MLIKVKKVKALSSPFKSKMVAYPRMTYEAN